MSGNENRTIDRACQCGNARFAFKPAGGGDAGPEGGVRP